MTTQREKIVELMKDGRYLTLGQIVEAIGGISECGASARLRECRKHGWTVNRRKIGKNFFAYQIVKTDLQLRFA